jgi:hypothetical protein
MYYNLCSLFYLPIDKPFLAGMYWEIAGYRGWE